MTQLALVQKSPAFLDKQETIELAVSYVEEAAANGAELVVFTECFIPGYPTWIQNVKPKQLTGTCLMMALGGLLIHL